MPGDPLASLAGELDATLLQGLHRPTRMVEGEQKANSARVIVRHDGRRIPEWLRRRCSSARCFQHGRESRVAPALYTLAEEFGCITMVESSENHDLGLLTGGPA